MGKASEKNEYGLIFIEFESFTSFTLTFRYTRFFSVSTLASSLPNVGKLTTLALCHAQTDDVFL